MRFRHFSSSRTTMLKVPAYFDVCLHSFYNGGIKVLHNLYGNFGTAYWQKLIVTKLRFSWKENLKKCTNFEEQKGKRYIREKVYIGIIVFSCLSSTKPCLRFLLNCFVREIKGFYQSSFGNEVDFRDIMNVFLNILAKN